MRQTCSRQEEIGKRNREFDRCSWLLFGVYGVMATTVPWQFFVKKREHDNGVAYLCPGSLGNFTDSGNVNELENIFF